MKTNDARQLSSAEQKLLRIKAVNMVFIHGYTQRQVAKVLDVARTTVVKWCKAFEEGGYAALELGRRGRRPGEQQLLKPHQCATIVRIIKDRTPDQIKMPFVLWERVAVRELIESRYGISLALRTVSDYLRRWGMTPQRPVARAYAQSNASVDKWLKEEYPKIHQRAQNEGATIIWSDETGVQNTSSSARSYAPIGTTPVIKKEGKKLSVNMISAVTNRGHVRFMIYSERMTQQTFIRFLSRLIKSFDSKLFVIVDNLKVHHGKLVAHWREENKNALELFFIPSYSPELNPDEYLNRDLKKNVHRYRTPRTNEELKQNIISFMRALQKLPERVCKYFNSTHIRYAMA